MRETILGALARLDEARPAGEAAAYAALEARANPPALAQCDGCTQCATRCVDHIDLTYPEFSRLLRHLAEVPEDRMRALLAQEKRIPWGEEATVEMCPFLDMETRRCAVYAGRPLICRLFGFAPWLPCPNGQVTEAVPGAVALLQAYAGLERRPLRHWLARAGLALPGVLDPGG